MYAAKGIEILGASFDTPQENAAFAKKFQYTFPLLCDTERSLGMSYGACVKPSDRTAKRITYVIGPDGKIQQAIGSVDARTHPATLLETL